MQGAVRCGAVEWSGVGWGGEHVAKILMNGTGKGKVRSRITHRDMQADKQQEITIVMQCDVCDAAAPLSRFKVAPSF